LQLFEQDLVGLGPLGALDVDFGLDHRNQPGGEDLLRDFELLLHDRGNAFTIGKVDDRALLGPEHAEALRAAEEGIEAGIGFIS
jgi:hypothetical protein